MVDLASFATVYSKNKDGALQLTPNFTVKEFACKDGSDPVCVNFLCACVCQIVRNWFGQPFSPNSAYRTVAYNATPSVGGASRSNHIYGNAVDIPARGCTPKQLYDFLDKLLGNSCELILYTWGCHVGIQNTKKRMTDRSYKG